MKLAELDKRLEELRNKITELPPGCQDIVILSELRSDTAILNADLGRLVRDFFIKKQQNRREHEYVAASLKFNKIREESKKVSMSYLDTWVQTQDQYRKAVEKRDIAEADYESLQALIRGTKNISDGLSSRINSHPKYM